MLFPLENFPVHWVDGMKISKNHFIDSDKYVTDLVRDASSSFVTPTTYGLIPSYNQSKHSIDLQVVTTSPSSITVSIKQCHAITAGGFKISIDKNQVSHPDLTAELNLTSDVFQRADVSLYNIVIVADPYRRTPIGTPSVEEMPPRHPYTDVHYKLFILPNDQISECALGSYCFMVGKIKNEENRLSYIETFIPACTSIQSHAHLIDFHSYCVKTIQQIQQLSFNIIRKIQEKNRSSDISKHIQNIIQELLSYIAQVSFSLKHELPEQSPMKFFGTLSSMAHVHYTSLQCIQPKAREELYQYIFEWTDITPTKFEQMLISAITTPYQHGDVYESITSVRPYLEAIEIIWAKMQLLEFIGQRKENMVVMKDTIQEKVVAPQKRWSILD